MTTSFQWHAGVQVANPRSTVLLVSDAENNNRLTYRGVDIEIMEDFFLNEVRVRGTKLHAGGKVFMEKRYDRDQFSDMTTEDVTIDAFEHLAQRIERKIRMMDAGGDGLETLPSEAALDGRVAGERELKQQRELEEAAAAAAEAATLEARDDYGLF